MLENFYPNLYSVGSDDYKLLSMKCFNAGINRWTKFSTNIEIENIFKLTKTNQHIFSMML